MTNFVVAFMPEPGLHPYMKITLLKFVILPDPFKPLFYLFSSRSVANYFLSSFARFLSSRSSFSFSNYDQLKLNLPNKWLKSKMLLS